MAKKGKKKSYKKKSKGKINLNYIIDGLAAELGPEILENTLGISGDLAAVGTHGLIAYFRKNDIAWYQTGRELAQLFGGGIGAATSGGSFWD